VRTPPRNPAAYKSGMIRERMTTIWSLKQRDELPIRVYYSVLESGRCRVLRLERIERFADSSVAR
jgi:hypothetical protein